MRLLKEWLASDGHGLYKEAKEFSEKSCGEGETASEPYLYKYKAREILKGMKSKLEDFLEDGDSSLTETAISTDDVELCFNVHVHKPVSIQCYLGALNYELALNFIECEEVSTGDDYLKKSLQILDENPDMVVHSSLLIAVHNQLAILWSSRGTFDSTLEHLTIAKREYEAKKEADETPLHFTEIWENVDNVREQEQTTETRKRKFENLHTLTLYYLAQVYGRLDQQDLSAKYCHITLARQMKAKDYDPRDWSLSCATLSQYYVTTDQYNQARYCLSCADVVNKEAIASLENLDESLEGNEKTRLEEKIYASRADVSRCWAKYGLNLLKDSHDVNVKESSGEKLAQSEKNDLTELKELVFPGLEETLSEDLVSDEIAKTYAAAKAIFTFSLKKLQNAKEFYKLDGYVSDFVEITQDVSQLYKYLAFFDDQFENRCKMHKRRVDMLNAILVELNPQHFLQICRQLTFEIAETYGEMAELKKAIIEESPDKLSVNSVKKMNHLLLQAVKFYTAFIDSYRQEGNLPAKFEDDDVRGILLSFFCMARINAKYMTNDRDVKINYMLKEKECYQFIVDYREKNKDMPKVFDSEISICEEMLALFNAKMNNVLNSM